MLVKLDEEQAGKSIEDPSSMKYAGIPLLIVEKLMLTVPVLT